MAWVAGFFYYELAHPKGSNSDSCIGEKCFHQAGYSLKEGDTVWLKLPYGDFSIEEGNQPIVLIAGGTGISPFLSYLDFCVDNQTQEISSISLYYGVKNSSYILFEDKFAAYSRMPHFETTVYLEEGEVGQYESGRLAIESIYLQNKESVFYLSGPLAMIDAFKAYLVEQGVETERIRIDEW